MLPRNLRNFVIIMSFCTLWLTIPPGGVPAYASQEDVALFKEALSDYGQWFTYGSYGPVWRPRQISPNWRPYTNGRWVPTQDGYVFETDEPWGWATYHYGNWLLSKDHGWIWVPGRTWYPHTVNWRTSDDNVGWAPVAPPEFLETESYVDSSYSMAAYDTAYNTDGSYLGNTLASTWIFTRATDFLLGWGQPYSSAYSYINTGVLLGPQYIPAVYEQTVYVINYVSPSYATNAYYNWGPPLTYVTRVTKIKSIESDRCYKDFRLAHLRNVIPPAVLMQRHPAWREVFPMAGTARPGHLRSVSNFRLTTGKLNYPDAIPAPASLQAGLNVASHAGAVQAKQLTVITGNDRKSADAISSSKRPEALPKVISIQTSPKEPVVQPLVVSPSRRHYQAAGEQQKNAAMTAQENLLRKSQAERLQNQQRAEQELKMRQQRQLEMDRRQQEARNRFLQEQQQHRQQQMQLEQQRQTEIMRQHQQAQMQQMRQRQAEMIRQQQLAQQQRQAELMRVQQLQHRQQMIQHAPPPQRAVAQPPQKKRDKQQQ
jgi:Family of unknown function (DUF6600)